MRHIIKGIKRKESKMDNRKNENRKSRIALFLTSVLAAGMLAGCGTSLADIPLKDMDVDSYVTLGAYMGLEVALDPVTVDEGRVAALVNSTYYDTFFASGGVVEEPITDRPVKVGDTTNIDYVGKKDDVAFVGGTAEGYNLTIGTGQFIDGFEDGLVGVMPGETVDLNLTFPKGYGNAELAGQEVVFTVTVNYIMPWELDDTVVASIGIAGVNNAEDLNQYMYDYLYSNEEQVYNSSLQKLVLEQFMNNCVFNDVPEELLTKYGDTLRSNVQQEANYYGMDADTFLGYAYGMTLDEFVEEYAPEAVRQDLAFQAVANREDLNISDDELNEILLEYALSAGYNTVEEYVGDTPLEAYREYFLYDKVLKFLIDNTQISN